MKPADITLQQLGGRGRLKAMIGAKDFFSDDNGQTLMFKYPRNKAVRITLNGNDLYDIEFLTLGRLNRKTWEMSPHKITGAFFDVGVENLRETIEEFTGLYLSMGR